MFFADGECIIEAELNRINFSERNRVYSDSQAEKGICFRVAVLVKTVGGSVLTDDSGIVVECADEAIVFSAIESSFNGYAHHPFLDEKEYKNAAIEKVLKAY